MLIRAAAGGGLGDIVMRFGRSRALVVGDVMLDVYMRGTSDRLSPEAPVPVLREVRREHSLGGAANVAHNIASLGGSVRLCGVIGGDESGSVVRRLCAEAGIDASLVADAARVTTEKARLIAGHHQIARVDREDAFPLDDALREQLIAALGSAAAVADVVLVSDYAKGTMSLEVVRALQALIPPDRVIADFKPCTAHLYAGVGIVMPNLKEARELTGIDAVTDGLAEDVMRRLARRFSSRVVLKRGSDGISAYDVTSGRVKHVPTRAREVYDVTGAGDTASAVLGLAVAAGAELWDGVEIANYAAGIAVEKEGTAVTTPNELMARLPAVAIS